MGMLDYYIPDPPMSCPVCGETLSGWQGKDADCRLLTWKQGEKFPIKHDMSDDCVENDTEFLESLCLPATFEFYSHSCKCNRWITAYGYSENGVWVKSELATHLNWRPGPQNNIRDEHKIRRDLQAWLESKGT